MTVDIAAGTLGLSHTLLTPISTALHDMTAPSLGLTQPYCLAGCAPLPTELPSSKDCSSEETPEYNYCIAGPRPALQIPSRALALASVPVHVAEFLFRTYVTRIIPQYPIFHQTQVENAFNSVFVHQADGLCANADPSPWDIYVVSLILAISLSTAARIKHARAHTLATGLFRNAMLRSNLVLTNDLCGLQALLLLIQYAFLDPTMANLWLLTGLSSEACIDMGLHQDLADSSGLNVLERDIRRRVFWCAWEMEVAVSAAFHRPLRTLPKLINVAFPSEFDDRGISASAIDTHTRRPKAVSRRIWLFRQVEATIISVLYQNEPLSEGVSLEAWMANIDDKINDWKIEVHQAARQHQGDIVAESQWKEMKLYADIASQWILVQLYRPCPKIKNPERDNLTKAAFAAVKVADGYWEQQTTQFGFLKYVFHPCYHVFSSALVFLQALQYCQGNIAAVYSLEDVEEQARSFPRFFTTIVERWPAAARCLEEYNRLLRPILESFSTFVQQKDASGWQETLPDTIDGSLIGQRTDLSNPLDQWPFVSDPLDTTGFDYMNPVLSVPYDWNDEFAFELDFQSLQ